MRSFRIFIIFIILLLIETNYLFAQSDITPSTKGGSTGNLIFFIVICLFVIFGAYQTKKQEGGSFGGHFFKITAWIIGIFGVFYIFINIVSSTKEKASEVLEEIENIGSNHDEENEKWTTIDEFKDLPGFKHHDLEDIDTRKEILKNCGFDFEEAEYHVTTLIDREKYHIMSIKNSGIKPPYECSIIYTATLKDKQSGEDTFMNVLIIKAHDRYIWENYDLMGDLDL